ncbi:MAG: RdgB/HAM1 family non-canonical purine NTP pyrophosphatase [Bacteroidota bacterium]|nr:RdgB/HAM1 family non-canonical purine NTP pyrophosphatase [Bacteroidota bacterium]
MKIILATHNIHKREELIALAGKNLDIEILPDDFPEIPETGNTLDANARMKARFVFDRLHQSALADDTGLEVDALAGAPGVYTARFAGENATYDDNCRKLLSVLKGNSNRRAKFVTVICFIDSGGNEHVFEGEVKGNITEEYRGSSGFGYDPIFEPEEGRGRTFAEMSASEKNSLSHRSRAMAHFLSALPEIAKNGTE